MAHYVYEYGNILFMRALKLEFCEVPSHLFNALSTKMSGYAKKLWAWSPISFSPTHLTNNLPNVLKSTWESKYWLTHDVSPQVFIKYKWTNTHTHKHTKMHSAYNEHGVTFPAVMFLFPVNQVHCWAKLNQSTASTEDMFKRIEESWIFGHFL